MEHVFILGLIIGVFLGSIIVWAVMPRDQSASVYKEYVDAMKQFATAYSELSVQFVNQHLPSAPQASFTRHMPKPSYNNNGDPFDSLDLEGAMQPPSDDHDILGGTNDL